MRWWPWTSRLSLLAAIGVVTAVSGCGGDRGAGESAPPSVSVSANPVTGGSPDPSVPVDPVGESGSPVAVAKGEVSVVVGAGDYAVGAVIRATVANGLDRAVYTEDFKTACSIAFLQRRDGAAWTSIVGCRLGRPTATVAIGPGLGRTVEFDPASFHLTSRTQGPAFAAGRYRVTFTYRLEPRPGGEDPLAAHSPEFTIH
jgi:hypothetical protein